jgi:D-alanyl-lipoteichoic acid acyltransferase DltB (MBOAT superfamily)
LAFNSLEYAIFFAGVFVVFWALGRPRTRSGADEVASGAVGLGSGGWRHLVRTLLLVFGSAWFYSRFDYGRTHPWLGWVYLGVLFCSATLDFFLAQAIHRSDDEVRRKRLMIVSIVYNLGVLAYFKYTNFGIDAARQFLGALGVVVHPRTLKVVLPIGISFFTFETMSYTIDVYRRELVPRTGKGSFLEYLLFISFFPHLVAGPIIRPKDMLPQLRADPELDPERGSQGMWLIACGLLKKVVIADYLALNMVDRVFDRTDWFSGPEVLAGIYSYALQIYCDFSGYTDIAIGSALLLGYVLPKNFDSPYQSTSLQEFWRRWHISLSSWLRDYLYIPLGGSKGGPWKTYRNLAVTMLLGGLWHGASWNFVLWGAMHGGALAATRMWQRWRARRAGVREEDLPADTLGWSLFKGFLTFHYVCLAWVFFRATGFSEALLVLKQLFRGGFHFTNLSRGVVLCLLAGFATHLLPDKLHLRARDAFVRLPAYAQGGVLFGIGLVLREVATSAVVPFVYFQF